MDNSKTGKSLILARRTRRRTMKTNFFPDVRIRRRKIVFPENSSSDARKSDPRLIRGLARVKFAKSCPFSRSDVRVNFEWNERALFARDSTFWTYFTSALLIIPELIIIWLSDTISAAIYGHFSCTKIVSGNKIYCYFFFMDISHWINWVELSCYYNINERVFL